MIMSGCSIRVADLADRALSARIDGYVVEHPQSTLFHRPQWSRMVERGCGQRSLYLLAERAGVVVGCLPLSEIRSKLFGNALVSAGFATRGGIIADDEWIAEQLADWAWRLAQQKGLDSAELRGGKVPNGWVQGPPTYANFDRSLPSDDEQLLKSIPKRQRAEIRRALKAQLVVSSGTDRAHREAFFQVYAESVRNLGTPVFPLALFEAALDEFGESAGIDLVPNAGRPLAAMIRFDFKGICQPYWGGGTLEARQWRANDLLYYEVMRRGLARGCTRADFGRSKIGSGPCARKRIWGFEETALVYAVRTRAGTAPRQVNPLSPKYRLQVAAWQKLPLFVANRLGPVIARGLG
jgi:FemAB-related protein (PEP-CTERM system-associated)